MFGASLSVLHVIPDNHLINEVESETDLFVEHKLEKTSHKTFILSEDKPSIALLDFIKTHEVDVIVLEQKKHSFLHNLIYPSTTKEIAFSSPIPVLTIHS
jgi:nucleotide-binding universal stress UspA family protein